MRMTLGVLLLLVLCASPGRALNILPNSSFELWLANMPVGWLTSELLYPGSAAKDSNRHSGDWCVKLVGGDTSAFMSSGTVVRAGYHYDFTAYAVVPGLVGGSFVLQFLTLLGNPVGGLTLVPVFYSTGYREYDRWITAPESAAFLSVSLATLPGATVYVDDVTVDDTTLTGQGEGSSAGITEVKPLLSKVVVLSGSSWSGQEPGALSEVWSHARVYDACGRRVGAGGPVRAGVCFLVGRR